jgi:fibronectin type 3 domain-containing protein
MKSILLRALLLTSFLFLGWSYGEANADMIWSSKCGEIKPNQNPPPQQMNCLLTNAALEENIPPEIVKAVAAKESDWRQFDQDSGQPLISQDGGIGIMQITNLANYDQEKLKYDISYNIQAGVEILKSMYVRTDLPKIKNAGQEDIENWYFPVMAYNGTKPVNSPLYQLDGSKNTKAYQERVFDFLEKDSFLVDLERDSRKLAQFPFSTANFIYNRDSDENIIFNIMEYTIIDPLHTSRYLFHTGDKVFVTDNYVNLRSEPSSSSDSSILMKNNTLIINGDFAFDQSPDSQNRFVWYPVLTEDKKLAGYISSAYISDKPIVESPTNVKVISNSYNSIKVSWSAVSGVSGYEIYRSTSSTGTFTKIATTSSNSFTNTSLSPGTTYYYKVRAYKSGTTLSYSLLSSVSSAKPIPATPISVKASSSSYNSIKTNWSAVSGANGYLVYRATSSTGSYSYVGSTTSTSYNSTGLETNKPYYYKIRAYKTVGTTKIYSNYSAIVSAKPIPSAPATVKASSSSYNSIKTNWSAVSGANGYLVYRATSSTGSYSYVGSTTSTSFNNTGLATNKLYYYKIRAYRTVGSTKVYSNYSAIVTAKPIPSTPASVKAASSSYNSIKTNWSAVSGASGYLVYRATSSTGSYAYVGSTTSSSFTNTGLATNKPYYFKIRAYRTVGSTKVYSNYSAIVTAKPIPSVPTNFKASRLSSKSIKLTWNSVSGASGYQLYRSTSKTGTYSLVKSTTAKYYINSGLTKGKTYYYKLRAYRTLGAQKVYSGWTSIISCKPY